MKSSLNEELGEADQMYDEFDGKVSNIQSLLDLKAEKKEMRDEIDAAVGGISSSLSEVKSALPDQGVMSKIKNSLNDKANRNDLLKLKKQLRSLSGEDNRDDPGLSKRCLSCDRPIVTNMQTIELINQANLTLTRVMSHATGPENTIVPVIGGGGQNGGKGTLRFRAR